MTPDARDSDATFEEVVGELEEVVRRMGAPDIGIEEAAGLYERARELHESAVARLDDVEKRIAEITAED